MKIRVRNIKLPLDHKNRDIYKASAKRLSISEDDIVHLKLVKKSVDARRKEVYFNYVADLELRDGLQIPDEMIKPPEISQVGEKPGRRPVPGSAVLTSSPVIVGAGPAGLFCALYLAQNGYKPVVVEQGQDMDSRVKTVTRFWKEGVLNTRSNAQFGEGGAGTFSDGKLTTRIGDKRVEYVLRTFVRHGAGEEILYLKKPHIGTDAIREIVKKIRQDIISLGGEFYFDAEMTGININNECIKSIIINNRFETACSVLVLAVGNSARGVYRMLAKEGVSLVPKPFALGVRVEHPQELIDKIQYGDYAGHPRLGAADYHLTYQDRYTGRSLYTFCMCPGGYVIGSSSEEGQVVTNGMSYSKRDNNVANSAVVVTVTPKDWDNRDLGGVELQQELERKAFKIGGGNYRAPAQFLTDFLNKRASHTLEGSLATYKPGVTPSNLWELLPREICEVMVRGIKKWDSKMKGFINERAVLTGVETRTSAPLRIKRKEDLTSLNVHNMYPCGEGAGYAGGIVSSAVDGIKVAEKIIERYKRPANKVEICDESVIDARDL